MKRLLGFIAIVTLALNVNAGSVTINNTTSTTFTAVNCEVWNGGTPVATGIGLSGIITPGPHVYGNINAFLTAFGVTGTSYGTTYFLNPLGVGYSCGTFSVGTMGTYVPMCGGLYYLSYSVSGASSNVLITIS